MPQEGNSPMTGQSVIPSLRRGVYGGKQNESGRRYGTTAEDLRQFPNKDAGEEDYRSFVISDQMNLDYFRTRHEKYYFDYRQEENPTTLNIKIQKNTFPTRMSSSYFFFNFKGTVTLPAQEAGEDAKKMSDLYVLNYKFWRMLKDCSIQMGSNCQEVSLHLNCYNILHRIMYFLQLPVSKSNALNEFAFADMFSDFHVDTYNEHPGNSINKNANAYNLYLMGLDPTVENATEEDVIYPFNFQIVLPLTLLHPMFNYDSVLPPEVDLQIKFNFFKPEDVVKKIFINETNNYDIKFSIDMKNCFLHVEQPEQNPHTIMSLKTKEYKYSPITLPVPYVSNLYKNAGQKTSELILIPENGKMPVKIDFLLIKNENVGKQLFVSQIFNYLKSIRFIINQPFPARREYEYFVLPSSVDVAVPGIESARKDFNFVLPEYQAHHNLQYSNFGEQFVSKGFKYPLKGSMPTVPFLNVSQFKSVTAENFTDLTQIGNAQYFQQAILQPSNQFNENPYPTVRGSLSVILEFNDTKAALDVNDLTLLCNFYYNYELHMENDKVSFLPLEDLGVNLDTSKKGNLRN